MDLGTQKKGCCEIKHRLLWMQHDAAYNASEFDLNPLIAARTKAAKLRVWNKRCSSMLTNHDSEW